MGSPPPVRSLIEEEGVDPAEVASLLEGGKGPTIFDFAPGGNPNEGLDPVQRHLRQIIHGVVDVDQIDYLMRDSHYTGVAHGVIDVDRLLQVLNLLVDKGNSVIIIEHHPDIIKSADWIIDLGPEGGDAGGYVVAEGTPEDVAQVEESYTGQFLRETLN